MTQHEDPPADDVAVDASRRAVRQTLASMLVVVVCAPLALSGDWRGLFVLPSLVAAAFALRSALLLRRLSRGAADGPR